MVKKGTAKRELVVSGSNSASGVEPVPKRTKGDTGTSGYALEIQNLNEALNTFNTSSLVDSIQANEDDAQLNKQFGERLVQMLQKTKALSAALREPSRRQRTTLSIRDVAMPQGTVDFEAAPIWKQQVKETNSVLFGALAELMGEQEEAEMSHLNVMVDAFAEELDQIRQSEDLGPNKLELLIDSLKTGNSSSR